MSPISQVMKIIIASEAFQALVVLLLDWLCTIMEKTGQRLKHKSQEYQQGRTDDDNDDLFFE